MSYCLNPGCTRPQNPDGMNFCQSCGSKLRLQDRYHAIRTLGEGGFGRTFLAADERNGNSQCVIKQLLTQHQGNSKVKELFEREANQLAELGDHPQIPTMYGYLEQGLQNASQQATVPAPQYLYILQEYVAGENLLSELQQGGPFDERQIREFLQEILPVLKFIHDRQVIHRDIKPENIMRRQNGQLVLIDFGAVKEFTTTNVGKTGTGVHTPGYAANEQMRGKVYPASDLYSLGATCIHLLTGISPHDIYDAIEDRLLWREELHRRGITISPHLDKILARLLQNQLRDRYQSADEVLAEFRPEVRLSQSSLEFTATKINQTLTQKIRISNSIPDTVLEGEWEVAPHSNDPPHTPDSHSWIKLTPKKFTNNSAECRIEVDTSKLMAEQVYERELVLHTNSSPETYTLTVRVRSAAMPVENRKLPAASLARLFLISCPLSLMAVGLGYWIGSWLWHDFNLQCVRTFGVWSDFWASCIGGYGPVVENPFPFMLRLIIMVAVFTAVVAAIWEGGTTGIWEGTTDSDSPTAKRIVTGGLAAVASGTAIASVVFTQFAAQAMVLQYMNVDVPWWASIIIGVLSVLIFPLICHEELLNGNFSSILPGYVLFVGGSFTGAIAFTLRIFYGFIPYVLSGVMVSQGVDKVSLVWFISALAYAFGLFLLAIVAGGLSILAGGMSGSFSGIAGGIVGLVPGVIASSIAAFATATIKDLDDRGFGKCFAVPISLLTLTLGSSLGIGFLVGFLNPFIIMALEATGLSLVAMLIYIPLNRRLFVAKYRQSQQHLIKP